VEQECRRIGREVLPAVRATVAELMRDKYGWRQERIAKALGVVQVAVSKYLNGRYSKEVLKMKNHIMREGLVDAIAKKLASGKNGKEVYTDIDVLCAELVKAGAS
jgi:predicted transcriptional regulator